MAQLAQFTSPVVCARTRLHADHARRQRLEERQKLGTADLPAQYYLAGGIHAMHLKNVFRDVVGCMWTAPLIVARCGDHYGTSRCRESGRRPPHQF